MYIKTACPSLGKRFGNRTVSSRDAYPKWRSRSFTSPAGFLVEWRNTWMPSTVSSLAASVPAAQPAKLLLTASLEQVHWSGCFTWIQQQVMASKQNSAS